MEKKFIIILFSILMVFVLASCGKSKSSDHVATGPTFRGGEACSSDVILDYNTMATQNSITNTSCESFYSEADLDRCKRNLEESIKYINDFTEKYPQTNCKALRSGEIKSSEVLIKEETLIQVKELYEQLLDKIRHH